MPRTAAPRAPAIPATPVRPWWVSAWSTGARTVRELRGTLDPSGPALRMTAGPDGVPVYVPVTPEELASTRAARWTWKRRRTLAPLPVAAGYAALNAAHFTGPDAARWVVVAALVAPLVAAAAWLGILGGDDRTPRTLRLLTATITALEGWWLAPDRWVPGGAVWAVAALAAAGSARRFRRRPDPEPGPDPDVPWEVARWEEKIGCPGGPLPGAVAHFAGDLYAADTDPADPDRPRIGFRLGVELVPGRQEIATLRGRLGVVAGVYGAAKAGTVLDEVDNEVRALVTFTTRRFLTETKMWTGPTLDTSTGRFVWQRLADGTPGHGQLWVPRQGVKHTWVVGATGGGKSGALDCLLAELLSAGIAVADLVDLKGGASLPHWRLRSIRYGTRPADAVAALRRGALLCEVRNARMADAPAVDPATGDPVIIDGRPATGRTWVDPSPEWPIYAVVIEEWPQVVTDPTWGPTALTLAAEIAALGRQALVMLILTSQGVNLDSVFGQVRVLRSNVQAGNVHVLWTDQGSGNIATATRPIDLSRIPMGAAGVGYLVGPGQPRDLQGRVPHVTDPWAAVRAAQPAALSPLELGVLDAADAVTAGMSPADAARLAAARVADPAWAAFVDKMFAADAFDAAAAPADLAPSPAEDGDPALPDGQRTILAALAAGGRSAADLRAALGGVTDQALRRHLNPLMDAGLAARAAHGVYVLTDPANPTPE